MREKLMFALMGGETEKAKKMIKTNNSLLNALDEYGRTPLIEAAINNNYDICKILVDRGADINKQDKGGWTALHFAAREYNFQNVELLLKNGADPNIQDKYGITALGRSLQGSKGRPGNIVKMLLDYGADKDIKNKTGVSAYEYACMVTNFDLKQYFE